MILLFGNYVTIITNDINSSLNYVFNMKTYSEASNI